MKVTSMGLLEYMVNFYNTEEMRKVSGNVPCALLLFNDSNAGSSLPRRYQLWQETMYIQLDENGPNYIMDPCGVVWMEKRWTLWRYMYMYFM